MAFKPENIPGSTPLDPDEIAGLIPSDVSTQGQLNQVEQQNIIRGELWAFGRKHKDLLTEAFVKRLHKRMFGDVWRWAGEFRVSNKTIGVDAYQISVELRKLLDDTKYWIEHETYEWTELAAQFHHRLVWIHPFPNGNGRHSRTMTDLLLVANGKERFTWGRSSDTGKIEDVSPLRARYVEALQDADAKRIAKLLTFVTS